MSDCLPISGPGGCGWSFGLSRPCPGSVIVYDPGMTTAVAQILQEVEQLSDTERAELRRALVERIPMSDDLTDDDFAALAAASFRSLDEEEDARRA